MFIKGSCGVRLLSIPLFFFNSNWTLEKADLLIFSLNPENPKIRHIKAVRRSDSDYPTCKIKP